MTKENPDNQYGLEELQEDYQIMLVNAHKNKIAGPVFSSYVLFATFGLLMKHNPDKFEEVIEYSLKHAIDAAKELKKAK